MINDNFKFRFDLFDGDGGGDGASSSGAEGSFDTGLGDYANEFYKRIGGGDDADYLGTASASQDNDPQVEEADASPLGKDNEQQVGTTPADEFAELTKRGGKYHEEFGKAVSQAVEKRFKNQADLKSTMDKYDSALSTLYQRYGLQAGDIDGITNALASDDSLFADEAERQGMSVEQYRQNLKLQADAERGRQITEAYKEEQRRQEMYERWGTEADELKQAFPNFDLGKEIESSEKFTALLDAGISVADAFFATHAQDILAGYGQSEKQAAQQQVITNIQQRAARPAEVGLRHNPATQRKVDPSTFTDEDMERILKDVKAGKAFTL